MIFMANYGSDCESSAEIDATGICDNFSYDFHKHQILESCVVLVNLESISENRNMFDVSRALNKAVCNVKYGKTIYNNIEKSR